jgi:hypothetical protein
MDRRSPGSKTNAAHYEENARTVMLLEENWRDVACKLSKAGESWRWIGSLVFTEAKQGPLLGNRGEGLALVSREWIVAF